MSPNDVDLLIIGGGINGAGIAADAQGRGLSVLLCDKGDLGGETSSASSKLIHGGLRYLEHMDFKLVRSALKERDTLLNIAPHLVHPIRFHMPYDKKLRSYWLLRLGLFVYDHLGGQTRLPKSSRFHFFHENPNNPLSKAFPKGFIYSDCVTDDARMVVVNLIRARDLGAAIRPRTQCIKAQRQGQHWDVLLEDAQGTRQKIRAKGIVNATGPWINEVMSSVFSLSSPYAVKKVKGSHIVVPKLYEGDHGYLLQHKDRRVIFVVPFQKHFNMIGTTEMSYEGDPQSCECSLAETEYLCDIVSHYFHHKIRLSQIIHTWSGVRPLIDAKDTQAGALSREYEFDLQSEDSTLPLLNVFGGKLTTYRVLAEQALNSLAPFFPHMQKAWTSQSPLPGNDFDQKGLPAFLKDLQDAYTFLPKKLLERYVYAYGTRAWTHLLKEVEKLEDMGSMIGHGLYEKEIEYLIEQEWACTPEDILWRRTKLGLHFSVEQTQKLSEVVFNLKAPLKQRAFKT